MSAGDLAAFDRNCLECRHGEPHVHTRQDYEAGPDGRGLVIHFEHVHPPEHIAEDRKDWRAHKKGCAPRPQRPR